mmetsp:Transcript_56193/g.122322  ORF Transcript_56193/g.122322 Transcript_56193/m.122322 type:complete len:202 (+) Transcript_56193:551-1156(+)|eukprot:1419492-Pleurochrysis_carterae.AAC.3
MYWSTGCWYCERPSSSLYQYEGLSLSSVRATSTQPAGTGIESATSARNTQSASVTRLIPKLRATCNVTDTGRGAYASVAAMTGSNSCCSSCNLRARHMVASCDWLARRSMMAVLRTFSNMSVGAPPLGPPPSSFAFAASTSAMAFTAAAAASSCDMELIQPAAWPRDRFFRGGTDLSPGTCSTRCCTRCMTDAIRAAEPKS